MSSCTQPANGGADAIARDTPPAKTNADPQERIGAYPILHSLPTISGPGLPRMQRRTATRCSLYQEPPRRCKARPRGDSEIRQRQRDRYGATGTAISDSDGKTDTRAIGIATATGHRGDRDSETETGATGTAISDSDGKTDTGAIATGISRP